MTKSERSGLVKLKRLFADYRSYLFLISVLFLFLLYLQNQRILLASVAIHEQTISRDLSASMNELESTLSLSLRVVEFMHDTPPVRGIVRATENEGVDPYDATTLEQWKERLATIFAAYMRNDSSIFQIRYIGVAGEGLELVRVERTEGGSVDIVLPGLLQSKADRGYFQAALRSPPESAFLTPIELNREFGQIEFPYRPTYRSVISILNEEGDVFGMLVVNFDAILLLENLHDGLSSPNVMYMLNQNRQFIVHPDETRAFGFELGDEGSWENSFTPEETELTGMSDLESVRSPEGDLFYYASQKLQIPAGVDREEMEVIIGVDEATIEDEISTRRGNILFVMGFFLSIAFAAILFYQRQLTIKQRLLDTETEFEAVFRGSHDAIIVLDEHGIITRWNPAAILVLGYLEEEALGASLTGLLQIPENDLPVDMLRNVMRGGRARPIETYVTRENNQVIAASVTLSPILDKSQHAIGTTVMIRDITEEKSMKDRITTMNESLELEVAERTRELEIARNEALEASNAKGMFLANMSHELRTPMNGIFGMINLLRREPLNERQKHFLGLAEDSISSLTTLINDILDFSKIEAGKLQIDKTPQHLPTVFDSMLAPMAVPALGKGLYFIVDLTGIRHPNVMCDGVRLRQILGNLVSNAVKFTSQGMIMIGVSTESRERDGLVTLRCSVRDTGIGIGEEAVDKLFDLFHQESASTSARFGGTGLGLAISRQLCRLMGGDIAVSSQAGAGSSFVFTLECAQTDGPPLPMLDMSNQHLSLVCDTPEICSLLSEYLERWGGSVTTLRSMESYLMKPPGTWRSDILIMEVQQYHDYGAQLGDRLASDENLKLLVFHALHTPMPTIPEANEGQVIFTDIPFTSVSLYRCLSPLFPGNMPEEAASKADDIPMSMKGMKVLVVDDQKVNLEVAAGMLEAVEVEVITARDGKSGINRLKASSDISLILLDCQMPVMDGYTMARLVREGEAGVKYQSIPIIAMTAGVMADDRERCVQAGIDDYLGKPVIPEEFYRTLEYWSRKGGAGGVSQQSSTFGTLRKTGPSTEDSGLHEENRPIWNRDAALKRLGGDAKLLERVVHLYLDTSQRPFDELVRACECGDFNEINRKAHSLKSIAANIGLDELAAVCRSLEQLAAGNDLQGCKSLKERLVRLYDEGRDLLAARMV